MNPNGKGKVIINRGGGYQDATRAYKIVIDGQTVGKIKAKKQEEFELTYGQHTIQFKIDWMGSQLLTFQLDDNKPIVKVECGCTSKMGSGVGIAKSLLGGKDNYIQAGIVG